MTENEKRLVKQVTELLGQRAEFQRLADRALEDRNTILADMRKLLDAALAINHSLRIAVDHVEFGGSMNDVDHFRQVLDRLDHIYIWEP